MPSTDLISKDAIVPALKAKDKKQALMQLADVAGKLTGVAPREIFEKLFQRERLGSTGVGRGIAIPHLRMSGLDEITCVFARLDQPIAFDSMDGEPVDLIFVLLTPEHAGADHLKALARISRLMRDVATAQKLRATRDRAALHVVLTQSLPAQAFPLAG